MSDLIDRHAAIDTEGLDEQIRCEMCRNPMHTDRGCDGNCKYDEKLYERIMQILGERIKPLPLAQPERPSEIQDILDYLDTTLHPIISPDSWNVYSELHDMASKLPSAEPERKTGHWKFDWRHDKATCSECRHTFRCVFDIDNFDNFCRHCGARMEVDVE